MAKNIKITVDKAKTILYKLQASNGTQTQKRRASKASKNKMVDIAK